jgi:hypothetical protein
MTTIERWGSMAAPRVENLLSRLEASGCEFGRNGVWYSAAAASKHLQGKLQNLERQDAIATTESFIDLGGSTSSSSGKPYLVKCGQSKPIESRQWLSNELRALRAAGQPTSKP